MQERDFPHFSPYESNEGDDHDLESDEIEDDESSEKKKDTQKPFWKRIKTVLSKWGEGQDESDVASEEAQKRNRIERLFDVARGSLNRLTGVESEDRSIEAEPPQDSVIQETEPLRPISIPNFLSISDDYDSEKITHDSMNENDSTETSLDKESAELIREEQDPSIGETNNRLDENYHENIKADKRGIDISSERGLGGNKDKQVTSEEELIRPKIDRHNHAASIESATVKGIRNEQEPVIIQGNAYGPALAGFVAGELLSRSRDKKIKKEAEKIKEQVGKQQKQIDNQNLDFLRHKQTEARKKFKEKRAEDVAEMPPYPKSSFEVKPLLQNKPEAEQTEIETDLPNTERHPEPIVTSNEKTSLQEKSPPEFNEEQPQYMGKEKSILSLRPEVSRAEQIHLKQIERAAERDVALESFYEKRHESKDVAPHVVRQAGIDAGSNSVATHDNFKVSGATQNSTEYNDNLHQPRGLGVSPAYRSAVKQGAVAGLAVVASISIIVFIWSLL